MSYDLDHRTRTVLENCPLKFNKDNYYYHKAEFKLDPVFQFCNFKGVFKTFKFRGFDLPDLTSFFMSCKTGPALKIKIVDENNILRRSKIDYKLFDKYHREDGPAKISHSIGEKSIVSLVEYRQFGILHREDGPAVFKTNRIIGSDETYRVITQIKEFHRFGHLHRTDGPACIKKIDGEVVEKEYYLFGKRHREDGPAKISHSNGEKSIVSLVEYRQFDILHRTDGPAVVLKKKDGSIDERYYLFGKKLNKKEHNDLIDEGIMQDKEAIESRFGVKHGRFESNNTIHYYRFGRLHRDDGPAIIRKIESYRTDKISHRYCQYGLLHREDGPAEIIYGIPSGEYSLEDLYFADDPTINIDKFFDDFSTNNRHVSLSIYFNQFGLSHRKTGHTVLHYRHETYFSCIYKCKTKFGHIHQDPEDNEPTMESKSQKIFRNMQIEDFHEVEYRQFGYLHRDDYPARTTKIKLNDQNSLIQTKDKIEYMKYDIVHNTHGFAVRHEIKEYVNHALRKSKITSDYIQYGVHHNLNGPAINVSENNFVNQTFSSKDVYSIFGNYFSNIDPIEIFRIIDAGPYIFGMNRFTDPDAGAKTISDFFNYRNLRKNFTKVLRKISKYLDEKDIQEMLDCTAYQNTILEEIEDHAIF